MRDRWTPNSYSHLRNRIQYDSVGPGLDQAREIPGLVSFFAPGRPNPKGKLCAACGRDDGTTQNLEKGTEVTERITDTRTGCAATLRRSLLEM